MYIGFIKVWILNKEESINIKKLYLTFMNSCTYQSKHKTNQEYLSIMAIAIVSQVDCIYLDDLSYSCLDSH